MLNRLKDYCSRNNKSLFEFAYGTGTWCALVALMIISFAMG